MPSARTGRRAGVLLHPTSLPGPFGIGDVGPAAHAWVDTLAKSKISCWQILPLGPTGHGDSPYSSFSAFAGNPLLISPDLMVKDGLIAAADLTDAKFAAEKADYEHSAKFKDWLLDRAFQALNLGAAPALKEPFETFCHEQRHWLDDYSLFKAVKQSTNNAKWLEWPAGLRRRESAALKEAQSQLADAIQLQKFKQFVFARQWDALRQHAKSKGVAIIGDAPIFVAADSADVWSHPDLFLLNADREMTEVAGVPPDYFSETGQLWGNPLYDWPAMKKTGYAWWVSRLKTQLRQVDVVRLDHFRGFVAAWHVPAEAETAITGQWKPGPGADLFETLKRQLQGLPLVAEDLGVITDEVDDLRAQYHLPGMKVLQFAFGGDVTFHFLPHNFEQETVVYTGTHDNDTTKGWWDKLPEKDRGFVRRYIPRIDADPVWELIRAAWASVADLAIVPLQDVLNLGSASRMNTPGVAEGNWTWRFTEGQLSPRLMDKLGELTELYNRKPNPPAKAAARS